PARKTTARCPPRRLRAWPTATCRARRHRRIAPRLRRPPIRSARFAAVPATREQPRARRSGGLASVNTDYRYRRRAATHAGALLSADGRPEQPPMRQFRRVAEAQLAIRGRVV